MTIFEKRSERTTYDERDYRGRDSHHGQVNYQQHASMVTAGNMMSTWTAGFYDYAEQVLRAQRQFVDRMLDAGTPLFDVARDAMSPDANEGRSANQAKTKGDQRHEGSTRSQKDECYNDDNTAEYHERFVGNNRLDDGISGVSRAERTNTPTEESAKAKARETTRTEAKRP
jgi:hypothetical protein